MSDCMSYLFGRHIKQYSTPSLWTCTVRHFVHFSDTVRTRGILNKSNVLHEYISYSLPNMWLPIIKAILCVGSRVKIDGWWEYNMKMCLLYSLIFPCLTLYTYMIWQHVWLDKVMETIWKKDSPAQLVSCWWILADNVTACSRVVELRSVTSGTPYFRNGILCSLQTWILLWLRMKIIGVVTINSLIDRSLSFEINRLRLTSMHNLLKNSYWNLTYDINILKFLLKNCVLPIIIWCDIETFVFLIWITH
jgi:hypothetical protein